MQQMASPTAWLAAIPEEPYNGCMGLVALKSTGRLAYLGLGRGKMRMKGNRIHICCYACMI